MSTELAVIRPCVLGQDLPIFPVPYSNIMDDGLERSGLVDALRQSLCLRNACDIAIDCTEGSGCCLQSSFGPCPVTAVKQDLVPLFDEQLSGHQSEACRGA